MVSEATSGAAGSTAAQRDLRAGSDRGAQPGEAVDSTPAQPDRAAQPEEPAGSTAATAGRPAPEPFRAVHLLVPLAAFAASRLLGHATTVLAAWIRELPPIIVLGSWDGRWYLRMALEGYPTFVGPGDFYAGDVEHVQSTIAFFPLYPLLSRGLMELFGLGPVEAEAVIGVLAGGAATCLVWALAREVYDRAVADRAAVLFAFAPGAIVLSMLYAEGLAIALSAGCLLLLLRRQWVWAGVLAALATATRPNALVLVGVCAWAAGVAVLRRREWRALAAPLLAPLGTLAYFTYLHVHTGDFRAWFDVQHRGWGERTDFGVRSAELVWEFLHAPFDDAYVFMHVASAVAAAALLALFLRRPRPPAELTLFALGVLGLSWASATLNARPRFVFFAFPLVIVLARWLRGRGFGATAAASGGLMTLLGVFYFLEEIYYP